jgi:hypothetical protein
MYGGSSTRSAPGVDCDQGREKHVRASEAERMDWRANCDDAG